jgi:hypothetical protein
VLTKVKEGLDATDVAIEQTSKKYTAGLSRRQRIALRLGAIFSALVGVVAGAGAAGASTTSSTDLTNGAGDTFFSSLTHYFQDHVIAAVLLLLALLVGLGMLIRWGVRVAKK